MDHEVEGEEIGKLIAVDLEPVGLGHQGVEPLCGQVLLQPAILARSRSNPESDIGVAAFVARPRPGDGAEGRSVWLARSSRGVLDKAIFGVGGSRLEACGLRLWLAGPPSSPPIPGLP